MYDDNNIAIIIIIIIIIIVKIIIIKSISHTSYTSNHKHQYNGVRELTWISRGNRNNQSTPAEECHTSLDNTTIAT